MCASVLLLSETRSRGRNGGERREGERRGRDGGMMMIMMMTRLREEQGA